MKCRYCGDKVFVKDKTVYTHICQFIKSAGLKFEKYDKLRNIITECVNGHYCKFSRAIKRTKRRRFLEECFVCGDKIINWYWRS